MFTCGIDTFVSMINYLDETWTPRQPNIVLFEVHYKQQCHGFATPISVGQVWINTLCEIAL